MNDVDRDARVPPGRAHPERHPTFASLRRLLGDEGGDTMIEALLSMTLLGIAFAVIYGGLATASIAAQRENHLVAVEAALSTAKRSVAAQPFTALCDSYTLPPDPPGVTVTKFCTNSLGGLAALQEITLRAQTTSGTISHDAVVYKGSR